MYCGTVVWPIHCMGCKRVLPLSDWPRSAAAPPGTLRHHRSQAVRCHRGSWAWQPIAAAPRQLPGKAALWKNLKWSLFLRGTLIVYAAVCFLLSFTLQSYVCAHPSTVLLDPLPAMTQLLDRFASYRIMSKLQYSLRGELRLHSVL